MTTDSALPPAADAAPARGPILIVGAGVAAVQLADALRAGGHTGPITLLADEPHEPYHRPPLSKAWLAGAMEAPQLVMRSAEALARKDITLRTSAHVTAIDPTAHTLTLADGSTQDWDGLALCTGATARSLPLPGADAAGVHLLRTRDDADALAAGLQACADAGRPLVVIGGGFIGLEVAATARKRGVEVVVLEAAPRLLARALPPVLSDWYAQLHRGHGVRLELGAQIAAIEADASGAVNGVRLADGEVIPAGRVLIGVGVSANDALAQAAGLACERGIVVDACGRTSHPDIVAAGDCTARRLDDGGLRRLESVQNATEQAKSAAAALLGVDRPFTAAPWFWSDQYDKKLQMAGLSAGADQTVSRGAPSDASFSLYHYRAGQLIAVDTVNNPREHLAARRWLDQGGAPTPEQVVAPDFKPA